MDGKTFVNLYKSFVCLILEYGNVVWGLHYILNQRSVEKVQRRSTKLIHGLHNMDYSDCLATLNLSSLQYQQTIGDMITVYKLIHNMFAIDSSDFLFSYIQHLSPEDTLKNYLNHLPQLD